MAAPSDDTIFALATAPGRAGIAVIRLSGPAAAAALAALGVALPPPRRAVRASFRDPASGEPLDDGLALWFPAPRSYSGEDMAELHLHGSPAVVAAVFEALRGLPGLRLAEPGEFTRRAFENGKLDLAAAEGVADLVAAETAAQRRQALRQLKGALGHLTEDWRRRLLHALAHVEAEIDFPEDEVPADATAAVAAALASVGDEIARTLADGGRGERLRDGLSVAIIGPPNAGKSSLLNALARREAAITAPTAGTTRDVVEVHLDLGGYPVTLADTAGLRPAADPVEVEGVRRAQARAAEADLVLVLVDVTKPRDAAAVAAAAAAPNALVLANKIDLAPGDGGAWADRLGAHPALRLSVATGEGMTALRQRLEQELGRRFGAAGGAPLITRARHRAALEACAAALARYPAAPLPELKAEELRHAVRALGRITGRVDVEDMLDIVFREFCIGK
jgi:tRNA modification GTPase